MTGAPPRHRVPRRPWPHRIAPDRWPPAAGALVDQVLLAGGSLLLQIYAARALGAEGLGAFALLFGGTVMATAVSTGLVGDSLTVLDRQDPRLRAALALQAALTVGLAAGLCLIAGATGAVSAGEALAWAAATVCFMGADLVRRLLAAVRGFWSSVRADVAGLTATLAFLATRDLLGSPSLADLLVALALGQLCAAALGWRALPAPERVATMPAPGAWRDVLSFGAWRAVQQFVRPTTLNTARWLLLVAAGSAAVGEVEAARIFVAPAMVLIQGVGTYLFASYAADRAQPVALLRRRADRAAALMLAAAGVTGVLAAAATPSLAWVVTGGAFPVSVVAVLGWSAYAASCAAVLPYGSLAAVRGDQARVFGLRVLESLLAMALLAVALLLLGWPAVVLPWILSAGSFAGGLVCRQVLLAVPAPSAATVVTDPVTP